MNTSSEPKLAPPGAGIPFPQNLIARFIVPYQASKSDWAKNHAALIQANQKICDLILGLDPAKINQRVLVEPIVGLEDSSRFWSPGMLLEHLRIVHPKMAEIIFALEDGKTIDFKVDTALVKPEQKKFTPQEAQLAKEEWSKLFDQIQSRSKLRKKTKTIQHPWFGKLNAHQWHYVMMIHSKLHLKQLRVIIGG